MPRITSITSAILSSTGREGVPTLPTSTILYDYSAASGIFLAADNTSATTTYYTSSNLIKWTANTTSWTTSFINARNAIKYYNGYWYAFRRDNTTDFLRSLWRSSDLVTWTKVWATGINSNWTLDINTTTGKFLATAGLNSPNAGVSSDGLNWTAVSLDSTATALNYNKGWNGSTIIAANYNNTGNAVWKSTNDGSTFYPVVGSSTWTTPGRAYTQSVAYGASKYIVALGQAYGLLSVSTDNGDTWSTPARPTNVTEGVNRIFWSTVAGKFIITNISVGGVQYQKYISISADGVTWTQLGPYASDIYYIVETGSKIYGFGNGGVIVNLTAPLTANTGPWTSGVDWVSSNWFSQTLTIVTTGANDMYNQLLSLSIGAKFAMSSPGTNLTIGSVFTVSSTDPGTGNITLTAGVNSMTFTYTTFSGTITVTP